MTPKGSRAVARGAAKRNPWTVIACLAPPRMGRRSVPRLASSSPRLSVRQRRESAAPSGAGCRLLPLHHGFRSPGANSTRGYNSRPLSGPPQLSWTPRSPHSARHACGADLAEAPSRRHTSWACRQLADGAGSNPPPHTPSPRRPRRPEFPTPVARSPGRAHPPTADCQGFQTPGSDQSQYSPRPAGGRAVEFPTPVARKTALFRLAAESG